MIVTVAGAGNVGYKGFVTSWCVEGGREVLIAFHVFLVLHVGKLAASAWKTLKVSSRFLNCCLTIHTMSHQVSSVLACSSEIIGHLATFRKACLVISSVGFVMWFLMLFSVRASVSFCY